jgi:hypothetical protein
MCLLTFGYLFRDHCVRPRLLFFLTHYPLIGVLLSLAYRDVSADMLFSDLSHSPGHKAVRVQASSTFLIQPAIPLSASADPGELTALPPEGQRPVSPHDVLCQLFRKTASGCPSKILQTSFSVRFMLISMHRSQLSGLLERISSA